MNVSIQRTMKRSKEAKDEQGTFVKRIFPKDAYKSITWHDTIGFPESASVN